MKGITEAALARALVMLTIGAGFVPAATAHAQGRDPVARAFEFSRGSRIGVSVQDIEESDAKDARGKAGVVVETVDPGGPADKAGVKTGDTITEFDGEKVRSVRQFSRLVQETPTGRAVAVALSRAGQRVNVTVTAERAGYGDDFTMRLLDLPARPPRPAAPPAPPATPRTPRAPSLATPAVPMPLERFFAVNGRRLGLTIETLDDQLAQFFGVKEGVLVKSVTEDSPAHKAGVKAGDVISSVNGRHVYETSDVNRAIDRMDSTDEFTLEIVRDKKTQTLKGKLEPRTRSWMF
jgi:serine protease Do